MPHRSKKKRKANRKKQHKYYRYNSAMSHWSCANEGNGSGLIRCAFCLSFSGKTRTATLDDLDIYPSR